MILIDINLRYLQINESIKQLDPRNEETIENLTKAIVEDRFKRARIDREYSTLINILINSEFVSICIICFSNTGFHTVPDKGGCPLKQLGVRFFIRKFVKNEQYFIKI